MRFPSAQNEFYWPFLNRWNFFLLALFFFGSIPNIVRGEQCFIEIKGPNGIKADVLVDGALAKISVNIKSAISIDLEIGIHMIEVKRVGFYGEKREITVTSGYCERMVFSLRPLNDILSFQVNEDKIQNPKETILNERLKISSVNDGMSLSTEKATEETTQQTKYFKVVGVSNDDYLYVRSGPHWTNAEVERLSPDTTCIVFLDKRKLVENYWWWRIMTPSGNKGWVNSLYLDPDPADCYK